MKKILITRGIFPEIVEALSARFEVEHNADDRPWPAEELARRLRGKHGAMATVMDKFDEATLAQAPDLKVISNIAVGYNNIDVAAATRRGIKVTNTPGVLDDTTADLTWALLMAAARRIAEGDAYVRAKAWKIAFGVQYSSARTSTMPRSASSAWDASARRSRGAPRASTCASSITTARASPKPTRSGSPPRGSSATRSSRSPTSWS
jgi:lactate dehydrogenase-like 2-hydroxyacid dehydrogenase